MEIISNIKKWYKEVDPFELIAIIFIIIGIIAIILVFFTSSFHEFFDNEKHDLTHYAELIGGFVGSLWALAGVLLFYASLASQKAELEEQKNLLVKQIDEVVKQTQEFRKQSDIQAKQQYENTYFQLLRFHNEIITSIVLEITDVDFITGTNTIRQINGRKSFVEYYDIYKRFFNTQLEILMTGELTIPIIQRIVDNSYRQFFDEYQADLGHYFRNLYNVLYFIDNLEDREKSAFYLELLHAQLSNYELALLYFHCASSNNLEFKNLLEKYELLATIPDDEIISMSKRLYNPKAFGKEDFDSDDDMNFGGGDSNENSYENVGNSFNLNDTDLSFSENDILSKFASLSKKQKGDGEESNDNFANLDFSSGYNDDFNFNFDDLNENVDKKDTSLDKLRQNFDKKIETKATSNKDIIPEISQSQADKIKESHSNDNLLGNLAEKLKKQKANSNQNEDDIWGYDDFDSKEVRIEEFDNEVNEEKGYLKVKLKDSIEDEYLIDDEFSLENSASDDLQSNLLQKLKNIKSDNLNELDNFGETEDNSISDKFGNLDFGNLDFENDIITDAPKDNKLEKINLLDKLKKMSDFDMTINSEISINKDYDIEPKEKLPDLDYNQNYDEFDLEIDEEDNLDSIKAKLNKKSIIEDYTDTELYDYNESNEVVEVSENVTLQNNETTSIIADNSVLGISNNFTNEEIVLDKPKVQNQNLANNAENKKLENLSKLIQKRR